MVTGSNLKRVTGAGTLTQTPLILFLCFFLSIEAAHTANNKRRSSTQNISSERGSSDQAQYLNSFYSFLKFMKQETGEVRRGEENLYSVLLTRSTRFFVHELKERLDKGKPTPLISRRDSEIKDTMTVMIQLIDNIPVLLGEAGVGKTAILEAIAQAILRNEIPNLPLYEEVFKDAEIIEVTPAMLSSLAKSYDDASQAMGVERYLTSLIEAMDAYEAASGQRKNVILFIDEAHSLTDTQVNALKRYQNSIAKSISMVMASTSGEYYRRFRYDPAALRRTQPIPIKEFSESETIEMLKEGWLDVFKNKYNVDFSDDAIKATVVRGKEIYGGLARPAAPLKLLHQLGAFFYDKSNGRPVTIKPKDVHEFIVKVTGLPVSARDPAGLDAYFKELERKIKSEVIGQDEAVDALLELWRKVLTGPSGRPESLLLTGKSGVGKTLLFQVFAKYALGSEERMHTMTGVGMSNGDYPLSDEFGLPVGLRAGKDFSGKLMDFVTDPSRGKYSGIIFIDEFEKANAELYVKLLSILGEGYDNGYDGVRRFFPRHIFVFASNKGANEVFPDSYVNWSGPQIEERLQEYRSDELVKSLFSDKLTPEFLGRISRALFSRPMFKDLALDIGKIEIEKFKKYSESNFDYLIEVSDELTGHLVLTSLNLRYGFRPTKNYIELVLSEARILAATHWNLADEAYLKMDLVKNDSGHHELVITNLSEDEEGSEIKYLLPAPTSIEKKSALDEKELRAFALREAARITANYENVTQLRFIHTVFNLPDELASENGYLMGTSLFRLKEDQILKYSRERVLHRMAMLFAGRVALEMADLEPDLSWREDLNTLRGMAREFLLDHGGSDKLLSVEVKDNGGYHLTSNQKNILDEEVLSLFKEAQELSQEILSANLNLLGALTDIIATNGGVSRLEVEDLKAGSAQFSSIKSCHEVLKGP